MPSSFITVMFGLVFQALTPTVSWRNLGFSTHDQTFSLSFPIKAVLNIKLYHIMPLQDDWDITNIHLLRTQTVLFKTCRKTHCGLHHSSKVQWCSFCVVTLFFHCSLLSVVIFCSSWNLQRYTDHKLHSLLTWTHSLVTNDTVLQFSPFSLPFISARNGLMMSLWGTPAFCLVNLTSL